MRVYSGIALHALITSNRQILMPDENGNNRGATWDEIVHIACRMGKLMNKQTND